MDLKQLEYFVSVADLGSFSRASRVLDVAQPAISRQIRALEVELRQSLLLRNGRGAVPTEAGRRLLDHARSILQQVERARLEVDGLRHEAAGHVTLGLPPTIARLHTAALVREFRRRFPEATASIVEGLSVDVIEWVTIGRADIGVLYNAQGTATVTIEPLAEEELCLIGSATRVVHARTVRLRDLPRYPLIIPNRPHAIRTLVESRLAALGLRPQVALEVDAITAIIELAAEGQGYAILPARAVPAGEMEDRLQVRPIVQPALKSSLGLATSAVRPATPIQKAAAVLLREVLGVAEKR
ncbi:MAG: LysR substrate-binding domain-containing protein [Burkholderiales bacterium]